MSRFEAPTPYRVRRINPKTEANVAVALEHQDEHHINWLAAELTSYYDPDEGRNILVFEENHKITATIFYREPPNEIVIDHYAIPGDIAPVLQHALEYLEAPAASSVYIQIHPDDQRMASELIALGYDFIAEADLPDWALQQPEWLRETKPLQWYGIIRDDEK